MEDGASALIEVRSSWAYVGPGLRIDIEVLGPEYSMSIDTLQTPLSLYLSRAIVGGQGEDLVEKQNAEQGLLPVLEDEAATYGYPAEHRHVVKAFREGLTPQLTFADGVAVIELLMAFYKSAELGRSIVLPDDTLATYVPMAAR
jgi:predicted dehydrogenase